MDAEKRTKIAIHMTRELLTNMFDDPVAMIMMIAELVEPEELQDKIYEVLEYVERTAPEEPDEIKAFIDPTELDDAEVVAEEPEEAEG